jgi:DNA-binding transcriptional LysR family regulator
MAEPRVEHTLLAVAAGAGIGLLPESAANHYATPGVCFVGLETTEPVIETAVVTHAQSQHQATSNFLDALTGGARLKVVPQPSAAPLALAA